MILDNIYIYRFLKYESHMAGMVDERFPLKTCRYFRLVGHEQVLQLWLSLVRNDGVHYRINWHSWQVLNVCANTSHWGVIGHSLRVALLPR